MSDIATKLEYLNTTKQLLKEKINNLGGSIDDNTTFRNYASQLQNVYDNLPKTEYQEGTEVNLGKTLKGKLDYDNGVVGIGQIEQDTTTGKNLFEPVLSINGTDIARSGVSSISVNNGEYTLVASATDMYFGQVLASGSTYIDSRGVKIYANGNEKISYKISNTEINRMFITAYDSNGTSLGYVEKSGSSQGTYVFPTNCDFVTFRIGKGNAVSGTTYKFNVMVAYGDEIPDYEQYTGGQASPNPSYPQQIKSVTGNQDVVVSGKNEFDESTLFTEKTLNGITAKFENGKLNITGTATTGTNIYWPYNLDNSMLGKTLTLSYSGDFSNINNVGFKKGGTDKVIINSNTPNRTFEVTQTLINDVNQFSIWITSGSVVNASINILLEENNQATTYEPYITPTTYPISLGSNKFYSIGDYADELLYDVADDKVYKRAYIGEVILNGTQPSVYIAVTQGSLFRMALVQSVANIPLYCTAYKGLAGGSDRTNNSFYYNPTAHGNENRFDFIDNRFTNADDFNDYLEDHNATLYYILRTPTLTEITDTTLINQVKALYNAHSNNGTTIITSNGNLPMIIKVRGLKGE